MSKFCFLSNIYIDKEAIVYIDIRLETKFCEQWLSASVRLRSWMLDLFCQTLHIT